MVEIRGMCWAAHYRLAHQLRPQKHKFSWLYLFSSCFPNYAMKLIFCGFSYRAEDELGNLEIMDTVYLNVSDTAGNMAAMQPFMISITATDNTAPTVTITTDLEVKSACCLVICPFLIIYLWRYSKNPSKSISQSFEDM